MKRQQLFTVRTLTIALAAKTVGNSCQFLDLNKRKIARENSCLRTELDVAGCMDDKERRYKIPISG